MNSTAVKLQVIPTSCNIITGRVRAIETEKDEGLLHHLLSLERDGQLRVFVGYVIGRVGRE